MFASAARARPRPVTKIVNGRDRGHAGGQPEAYEHVTRALLYEEEERWQEAAEELQRALPFDPDAAEVRARLAELFIRLGRLDDAAEQVRRSLQIAPTVEGYLAEAHLAARADRRGAARARDPGAAPGGGAGAGGRTTRRRSSARTWSWPTRRTVALDLAGALDSVRQLVKADAARRCAGGCSWRRWRGRWAASTRRGRGAGGRDRARAERRRGAHPAGRAADRDRAIAAAKAELPAPRSIAPTAPLEVGDAFAGWLVLRGDVAEAQELADRLIGGRRQRRHARRWRACSSGRSSAPTARSRWPSGPKLGARRPGRAADRRGAMRRQRRSRGRDHELPRRPAQRRGVLRFARCAPPRCCASRETVRRGGPRAGRAAKEASDGDRPIDAGDRAQPHRRKARRRGARGPAPGRSAGQGTRTTRACILARAAVDERRGDWRRGAGARRASCWRASRATSRR